MAPDAIFAQYSLHGIDAAARSDHQRQLYQQMHHTEANKQHQTVAQQRTFAPRRAIPTMRRAR